VQLSLLNFRVDDVEDDSELRGGIPTAHLIHGTARTFNAANYVLLNEMKNLLDIEEPKVLR
jgi:geranylgeranyl pyrophosphate synthase